MLVLRDFMRAINNSGGSTKGLRTKNKLRRNDKLLLQYTKLFVHKGGIVTKWLFRHTQNSEVAESSKYCQRCIVISGAGFSAVTPRPLVKL